MLDAETKAAMERVTQSVERAGVGEGVVCRILSLDLRIVLAALRRYDSPEWRAMGVIARKRVTMDHNLLDCPGIADVDRAVSALGHAIGSEKK